MSLSRLKWEKPWGPKPLRDTFQWLIKEINRRSPVPGIGVDVDETDNGRQISSHAAGAAKKGGGASAAAAATPTDPFSLIEGGTGSVPPLPTVSFVPGKIGNPIPTLDTFPLTDNPAHTVDTAGDYKAWIQVNITASFDNYHPQIDDSEIIIETADTSPDREDFVIEWVDVDNKIDGAFFILIADFTVGVVPDSDPEALTITTLDQWLNQSYRAIVMVGFVDDDRMIAIG